MCFVFIALLASPAAPVIGAGWTGRMSIWRNGAFATQFLDASCVGATIQMTLNLVDGARDHSKAHQLKYLDYAAQQSKYPVEDGGADPQGWANALNHFGGGDWGWVNRASMQSALQTAANSGLRRRSSGGCVKPISWWARSFRSFGRLSHLA